MKRVCAKCKEEAHDDRLKICISCGADLKEVNPPIRDKTYPIRMEWK